MAYVYNSQTMQPEEVADDKVTSLVNSGHAILPQGRIQVWRPDGTHGTIDAKDAPEAFGKGYRFLTGAESEEITAEKEFGNRPLAAGAAGAARGFSLGLSDVALEKTGLVSPKTLRGLEERNRAASLIGEGAGTAAGLLIPVAGEASAAKFAVKAGQLAGKAVVKGTAETLGKKVLQHAVEFGAEGLFYGAGHAVTESVLGETDLTAQKLAAGAGVMGIAGAGFGAATPLLGNLIGKAFKPIRRAEEAAAAAEPQRFLDVELGAATPSRPRTMPQPLETAPPVRPRPDEGIPFPKTEAPPKPPPTAPPGTAATAGPAEGPKQAGFVDVGGGILDRHGLEAPSFGELATAVSRGESVDNIAAKEVTKRAGSIKGLMEDFGFDFPSAENFVLRDLDVQRHAKDRLRKKGLEETAPRMILDDPRYASAKSMQEKFNLIQTKKDEAAKVIDDSLSRLDELNTQGQGFNASAAAKRIEEEVIRPLQDGPALNDSIIAKIEKEVERLRAGESAGELREIASRADVQRDEFGKFLKGSGKKSVTSESAEAAPKLMSFRRAEQLKRDFDPHLKWDANQTADTPIQTALKKVRNIIKDEVEASAEEVAISSGDLAVRDAWIKGKQAYGAMRELEKITEKRLSARESNRWLSLTDNMWGAGALALGGLNPVGLATAGAAALVNKWGRERLPQVMALALRRIETTEGGPLMAKAFRSSVKDALEGAAGTALGDFAPVLRNASARGANELLATHTLLSQASPEYRVAMEKAGFKAEAAEDARAISGRTSKLAAVEEAIQNHDKRVDASIDRFLGRQAGAPPAPKEIEPSRKAKLTGYKDRFEALTRLTTNPDAMADVLSPGTVLVDAAPNVAGATAATVSRAVKFLEETAPRNPNPQPITALSRPWVPSDMELYKWGKYVDAIDNPGRILNELKAGTVTPESIQALQAVYPKLLDDIRQRMMARVGEYDGVLSPGQRQSLSILMGQPVDKLSAVTQSTVQKMHAAARQSEAAPQRHAAPSANAGKLAGGYQTTSQRIEGRSNK